MEKSPAENGFAVSHGTGARILNGQEYSLQANRTTSEGKKDHPDRDRQFRCLNERARQFLRDRQPVISVDTGKKELVGRCTNNGHEWEKKGRAVEVVSHDFPDPTVPKAVPYGITIVVTLRDGSPLESTRTWQRLLLKAFGSGEDGWERGAGRRRRSC